MRVRVPYRLIRRDRRNGTVILDLRTAVRDLTTAVGCLRGTAVGQLTTAVGDLRTATAIVGE
jgi:hypothetical protein